MNEEMYKELTDLMFDYGNTHNLNIEDILSFLGTMFVFTSAQNGYNEKEFNNMTNTMQESFKTIRDQSPFTNT